MEEYKCNKLVVKHNKLIEFKGRMTTNELKLFSLIIADVRGDQEGQFEEYKIDISVLKETTKDKNFYNYIKETALKLASKRITVEGLDKKKKKHFTTINLIYKPSFTEGNTHLGMYIDKDLIPYIIDLKREFTRYEIENILRLNSSHSIRIYELLKQYESIGKREITIKDLREYLGIDEQEYERFYDFEKRILLQAKEEINDLYDNEGKLIRKGTDISIDYEKIKTGRRITSIVFKTKSKINKQVHLYNIADLKTQMGLVEENFNDNQIINIYELAIEKVQDQLNTYEYVRLNYLHIKQKARNRYAYLMKAIEEDYASAAGQLRFIE